MARKDHPGEAGIESPTVCAYPWIHVTSRLGGEAIPCCKYKGPAAARVPGESYEGALRSPLFESIRSKMLEGEPVLGCERCYEREGAGVKSKRQSANEQFGAAWDSPPRLTYFEFNCGNFCNLKCRGCSSKYSGKWAREERALGFAENLIYPPTQTPLSDLEGSWEHLTKIKLIGGEPLLYAEHEEFFRRLRAHQPLAQVALEYSTNGTVRASPFILECWRELKELVLIFSVDGLKEQNDFLRDGSRFAEILANIQWYRERLAGTRVRFLFHTVVNIYNVHSIVEIDDWLEPLHPEFQLCKEVLVDPPWMNICSLPGDEKQELAERFAKHAAVPGLRKDRRDAYSYIRHSLLLPSASEFSDFLIRHRQLQELRGLDSALPQPKLRALAERREPLAGRD